MNTGHSKKIAAFLMAVLLLLSCIIPAFAVGAEVSDAENPQSEEGDAGNDGFKYFDNKTFSEFAKVEFPGIEAAFACVLNLETGNMIYEKNPKVLLFPASTVKIMTAIVAYENIPDLETVIYASESAVKKSTGTKIHSGKPIKAGEGFTARELLYALLVVGANDAANVLAEYVGGTVEGFCDMMNAKAKEIGANDTFFANPTGLHDERMKTTAHDLALISRYAYYINEIVKISGSTNYTLEATNKTEQRRYLYNRNRMIRRVEGESNYFYKGTLGMSAGSTPEGGNCVIAVAQRSGLTYLAVVMNAPSTENENFAYLDTISLLNACFENFSIQKVASGGMMMCEIPVALAANVDHVTLYAKEDITALLPKNLNMEKDIVLKKLVYEDACAPINEGQRFGDLVVTYKDSITLGKTDLVANTSVDRSNLLYVLDALAKFFTGRWFITAAISAVVLFLIYCFIYYKMHTKRRGFRR
ncbi:MAG: D-alanyl-D-alanine carboxypeptidase [Clostridia bacterium]|nr:D-alanyl-D-alanine carboxypeptidase [Clostridia bacterium]